jgi:hypothetical protein
MGKITVQCSKCKETFELDEKWKAFAEKYPERVTCPSCKNGATKSATTAYKNTSKVTTSSKSKSTSGKEPVSAALFRKAYDELVAEFSDILPDVKDYLGGWTSTIVINRSK